MVLRFGRVAGNTYAASISLGGYLCRPTATTKPWKMVELELARVSTGMTRSFQYCTS